MQNIFHQGVFWFSMMSLLSVMGCAPSKMVLSRQDEIDGHMKMGIGFMENENYPKALQEFLMAERQDPTNPSIQNYLGFAYFYRESYVDAEIHYRKALSVEPRFTEARNNLGRLYIEIGRIRAALEELNRVIADLTYPAPEKAQYNLGLAYTKIGEYEKALAHFQKAATLKQTYCDAHKEIGIALYNLEKFERAIDGLELAAKVCKADQPDIFYYKSLANYRLGAEEKAVRGLKELIVKFPHSPYVSRAKNNLRIIQ